MTSTSENSPSEELSAEERSAEERDLAGYIDELIAAALRGHRPGAGVREPAPEAVPDQAPEETSRLQPTVQAAAPATGEPSAETMPEVSLGPTLEIAAARHTPASDIAAARSRAASTRRRSQATARSVLHKEFLALFQPTELSPAASLSGHDSGSVATAADTGSVTARSSKFLRRFLEQTALPPEPAPSGLPHLDARLAGGFGPGLHLVSGKPQAGKTAFVESAAWEAVSAGRPVLYYALKEGGIGAWGRLICTLGQLSAGPTISLDALRSRQLSPGDLENVARLDAALQSSVLPWLSLVDSLSARIDSLSAFAADLQVRTHAMVERHGRVPLLVVDDLERLLILSGARSIAPVVTLLGDVLAAQGMPCLLTMTVSERPPRHWASLTAQTTMALVPVSTSASSAAATIDIELLRNTQTGWTGTLPVLLDRRSGLFTHHSAGSGASGEHL